MGDYFKPVRDARVKAVRDEAVALFAGSPMVQWVVLDRVDTLHVYIGDGRSYEITIRERVG